MFNLGIIDEITRRLADALPPEAGRLREDLESRFRGVLDRTFEQMDLVRREEFDAQKAELERARARLDALQHQLGELRRTRTADPEP